MILLALLVLPRAHALQWRVRESIPGCTTAEDCSLNGKCDAGTCVCREAWRGDSCEILNLKNDTSSSLGYHGSDASTGLLRSSWGGSAHRGRNGTYHLITSEIKAGVGMTLWQCASQIIHATSPDPRTLPFVKQSVLFESFSHEPRCAFNPSMEGELVCFFVHNPTFKLNDKCAGANGTTPADGGCACSAPTSGGMPTMMSYITDIDDDSAEWSSPQMITVLGNDVDSNMSPYIFPNGSLFALYRDNSGTNVHTITASDWKKVETYTLHTDILRNGMHLPEDPFLYRLPGPNGGVFHSLHHAYPW